MKTLAAVMLMIMMTMLAGVALAQTQTPAPTPIPTQTYDFHKLKVGTTPPGWTCTQTGKGEAKWTIVRDDYPPLFNNVLEQIGSGAIPGEPYPTPSVYPICIFDGATIKDGFVQAMFKVVSGKQDQGAGIIWRVKDANNYNIFRANALGNDVTIYQTVNGIRTTKVRRSLPVSSNVWHSLRVDFRGNSSTVSLDGSLINTWFDNTFMEPGKVGVWTKADSVSMFDQVTYGGTQ